jgi:cathepsin B
MNTPVMSQETVDHVNSKSTWTASLDWVGDMTIEEAKSMLGTDLSVPNPFPKKDFGALKDYTDIPTSFDSRTQWMGCVHPIRNQERCGSCWAFAGSEALSDRYCT